MEWKMKDNGDWEAGGTYGDFLIWKDGVFWKSRYRSADKTKQFFLPPQKKLADSKKICQDNHYWEVANVREQREKVAIRACLNCKIPVSKCKGLCYRRGLS